ncbi:MAG: hypothetical protein AAF908_00455 [Pseudomonadota bacterium]
MSTGNAAVKYEPPSQNVMLGAVMAGLGSVQAAIAERKIPNLELARRYRAWRRQRALADFHAKLDRLSDKQLCMLGLDRMTLDLDVESLYDRYHEETAELKQLVTEIEPIGAERQLTAA